MVLAIDFQCPFVKSRQQGETSGCSVIGGKVVSIFIFKGKKSDCDLTHECMYVCMYVFIYLLVVLRFDLRVSTY
jgi:hypothetical protein